MSEEVKNRLKQKAIEKQIDLAGVNLKEDEKALFEEMEVTTLAEKSNLRTLVHQMQNEAALAHNTNATNTTATANSSSNTSTKKRGKATKKGRKGVPTITKPKATTTTTIRPSDGTSSKSTASTSTSTSTSTSGLRKVKIGRKGVQCRNLSNEQRSSLLQSLLKHKMKCSSNGSSNINRSNINSSSSILHHKLRKGALLEASRAFGVSTKTCKRIWERFLETSDATGSGGDVSHRKHQSGRPKKISSMELLTKIAELPKETRSSVRGLARALGMPHTTIHRRLKSGEIKLEGLSAPYSSLATTTTLTLTSSKKNGKGAKPNDIDNYNEIVDENEKDKVTLLDTTI
jgi:hypothetical protein